MTVESFTLIGEPPIEMTFKQRWDTAMSVVRLSQGDSGKAAIVVESSASSATEVTPHAAGTSSDK